MKVKISNLKDGVHTFDFVTSKMDCGLNDDPRFPDSVFVEIRLQKFQQSFISDIHVKTRGSFQCDRCLADFFSEIENSERITYTFDSELVDEAQSDIRLLNKNDFEIDFSKDVREVLYLAIPSKNICHEHCKGLCAGCGVNLNIEECVCPEPDIDPRWEALKQLIN